MNKNIKGSSQFTVKKKKFKFNFVDVALILLVIGCIITLIYFFSPISNAKKIGKSQEKNIEYTIEITDVDNKNFFGNVKEGDNVIDSVTKISIGTVKSVGNTKYTEYKPVDDGSSELKLEEIVYDDKINLQITISVNANYIEGDGFSVNSTRIAIGEKMFVKFPNFAGEGYCIGIIQN